VKERVVVDTSVLVAALRSGGGASREVMRQCLLKHIEPVLGQKLFSEYLDVFNRSEIFGDCQIDRADQSELLNGFLSVCSWVEVFFLWRPNLPDEADNHVLELAVAAQARSVITFNVSDFRGELRFPRIAIVTPSQFLKMR
jgi:putative PIN family toxin of toxin-antitoxin system